MHERGELVVGEIEQLWPASSRRPEHASTQCGPRFGPYLGGRLTIGGKTAWINFSGKLEDPSGISRAGLDVGIDVDRGVIAPTGTTVMP